MTPNIASSRTSLAAAAALVATLVAAGSAAGVDVVYRTLVLSGQDAPGVPVGTRFSFFSDPRVNDAGRTAFWADLAGVLIVPPNEGSIWSDRTGALALVLQEGDAAPWYTPTTFASIPSPTFNADGLIGVTGSVVLVGPVGMPENVGIFAESSAGSLLPIAREGEIAPGSGLEFSNLPLAPFNAMADTAFNANRGSGLWSDRDVALGLLVATGDAAPGTSAGTLFAYLDQPVQNNTGALLFRATLSGPDVLPANESGLWTDRIGELSLLARAGDAAPGTPAGVVYATFAIEPSLNTPGDAAFWASLAGEGIDPTNNSGIWTDRTPVLSLVARAGSAAPGAAAGQVFASFSPRLAQNVNGSLAFHAHLAGTDITAQNNAGLWSDARGLLQLIAREGSQVPGAAKGLLFAHLGDPVLNDRAQAAFLARLTGAGSAPATNVALLASDPAGRLRTVVRTGDAYDVSGNGSDLRTVRTIVFDTAPLQSGFGQFNNLGALVFKLAFTDGTSGLFMATVGTPADFNGDGVINVQDFIAFLNAYDGGKTSADLNGDGVVNVNDFLAFLSAYTLG